VVPSTKKRKEIAAKIARYSGFQKVMQNNLDVPYSYFWKELLRDQGFVGRLDSVIKGLTEKMQEIVLILMLN
jgi:hypothetical protein